MPTRLCISFLLLFGAALTSGPAAADLVSFFDFDGNLVDQSGNGTTVFGRTNGFSSGSEGQSISLAGRFNYLFIPIAGGPLDQPVQTLGAWVRSDQPATQQDFLTIEDFDGSTPNRRVGIDDRAGGGWQYTATTGQDEYVATGPTPDNDWTFVAARYDGTDVTFFVDGQSVTTTDNTSRNTGRQSYLRIGTLSLFGGGFRGEVDNLFLFDEALSDMQVENIRQGGAAAILAVSVPEPSVFGVGLFATACFFTRRRRRPR